MTKDEGSPNDEGFDLGHSGFVIPSSFVITHSSFPFMSRVQRLELVLFIATFFAFAYFNQGGGWNQNSRFAEVRAMVEEHRFAIDDFLIYQRDAESGVLRRIPMRDAEYTIDGARHRLAWVDMAWTLFPINEKPAGGDVKLEPMIEICTSGDLGYVPHTGHFHPN